ncbi:phosphotransferase [Klebsiella pneumoniae]|uniref:Phosphotransferase n=1 Tax=Klebsiella pneumoniae TaxID=573 RepID=A0A927HKQ2_KLEPN|nr:phosphotransferase [Klebsiella pneumoniae]
MEKIPGELLNDVLASERHIDREKVISDLLDQLVILEEHGLYHDDFRTWNVLIDDNDSARLIDFGSIGDVQQDCSWPVNIFQSFIVFVNEIFCENKSWRGFWRSAPLSPFQLPEPYSNWLTAFWKHPVGEWSFALLQQLFSTKDALPAASSIMDASDLWVRAQEPVLLESQTQIRNTDARVVRLESQINELTSLINIMGESIQTFEKREYPPQDVTTNVQPRIEIEQSKAVDSEEIMRLHTQLNDAQQEIENLRHEIAKIHYSRSWKMTKWYRYAGLQYYLLRQYGFKQRFKHLLKRVLSNVFYFCVHIHD